MCWIIIITIIITITTITNTTLSLLYVEQHQQRISIN